MTSDCKCAKEEKTEQELSSQMEIKMELCPKNVITKLLYCIGFLLFAYIIVIISTLCFDHPYCYGLVPMFDFDSEMNVPTFYSALTLVLSSVLLAIIAFCHKKAKSSYWPWAGLAIIFLFLSMDEFGAIHERFEAPVLRLLKTSGLLTMSKIFFYAWVIPYGIVLIAFAMVYAKFILSLPRKIMVLFLVSGAIYVTGAMGLEIIAGMQDDLHGRVNITYMLLCIVEEVFEMLGIALFIYALLSYIRDQFKSLTISVKKQCN